MGPGKVLKAPRRDTCRAAQPNAIRRLGYSEAQHPETTTLDKTLIDRFAAGARVPRTWLQGLTPTDLNATPVPGKWSVQQVVLHVLDSDLIATHRMKRIIAEDVPLLLAYDETRFAASLFYEHMDVALACDLFELNRRQMTDILRRLPDAAFERTGVHNQSGKVTLTHMLQTYIKHLEHHAPFVVEKRKLLGKPL